MAAKIYPDMSFDDIEGEIIYTRSAVEADPDAADLLPMTDPWMPWTDAARATERDARVAVVRAAALRRVSNARVDIACVKFGDELALVANEGSARFKRFFSGVGAATARAFVRLPFGEQLGRIGAWLEGSADEVLERHRPALTQWKGAGDDALNATLKTASARGDAAVARETLAEDLTRARDGLHARLVERANERGLPRSWPNTFFQPRTRRDDDAGSPPTPPS